MTIEQMDAIEGRLQGAFERVFGQKVAFRPDLKRSDTTRWDSLKHVEFMIALEQEFGVRFDGADATAMTGIAPTLEILRGKLA